MQRTLALAAMPLLLAAAFATPLASARGTSLCFGQTPTVVGSKADELFSDTGVGVPVESGDVLSAGGGDDRVLLGGQISELRFCLGRGGDHFTSRGSDGRQPFLVRGDEGFDRLNGNARAAGAPIRRMKLIGGRGNDTVRGGGANDSIIGGHGWDHLVGEAGNDLLRAGPGRDRVEGSDGGDRIFGESGNDWLSGGFLDDRREIGRDYVNGGPGRDRCRGEERLRCEAAA